MAGPMAVTGYFDQLPGLAADLLLAAMIDAGADPNAIEAAVKRHHGVDCGIDVTKGRVDGTRVTFASLSRGEASVPGTYRAIPEGGAGIPAGTLIGRVIGHLEKSAAGLMESGEQVPPVEMLGGRHGALRILVLCNALHLLGIESLHHEVLPFAAGIDSTPPLFAALMRGTAIRPVDRAPVDLPGCAVLTALSAGPADGTAFTLRSVGYGGFRDDDAVEGDRGDRGDDDRGDDDVEGFRDDDAVEGDDAVRYGGPVVRLCTGEAGGIRDGAGGDSVRVLETQIDDMNPQFYGHVVDLLLEAGALDAFLTPVIMKKNRPGVLLTVLAPPALAGRLSGLILSETTTIGLRSYPVSRSVLPRSEAAVETPYGAIRIKVVEHGDGRRYAPEYEDCRQAALQHGIPLADVYVAVHDAAGRIGLDNPT